ncbi:MAG: helix-turn-helix domain-containing protein [Ruminococcaceae bacterium]|nr:helix-turn-helix domain-containing protein [Oscillospiraceae bacterium]
MPTNSAAERDLRFFDEEHCFKYGDICYVENFLHTEENAWVYYHDFYVIDIVARGAGEHYIEGNRIPITVGDVFVVPPFIKHGYFGNEAIEICHIKLKSDFMTKYRDELHQIDGFNTMFSIEPELRKIYDKNVYLHLDSHSFRDIKKLLEKSTKKDPAGHLLYTSVSMLGIIEELCIKMHDQMSKKHNNGASDSGIIEALEYIHSHYSEKITIDTLVHISKTSRPTFNRHFKRIVGKTPVRYILDCRINAAKDLLAAGNLSKTEIAYRCGFYDVSHMDKNISEK